jgi:hypothetical protein
MVSPGRLLRGPSLSPVVPLDNTVIAGGAVVVHWAQRATYHPPGNAPREGSGESVGHDRFACFQRFKASSIASRISR